MRAVIRTKLFVDNHLALNTSNILDKRSDLRHIDMTGQRILNADDRRGNSCLYFRPFKAKIGIDHFTVYQLKIFAVAKRLCADDLTVLKSDILAVPCQIFAFYHAVSDCKAAIK